MKNLLLLLCFSLSTLGLQAQTFDVDTLLWNGPISKRINYVFLSDGYTQAEFPQFIADANNMMNSLFNTTPFQEYQDYFNVFIIKVPSQQSGADHPRTASDCPAASAHPQLSVNNYFGSTFDYFGIHRLLVPTNSANISSVLANNFPVYDQIFVVVNSPYYGGSGGTYATSSTHNSAGEIAIHEIGHSFASLADEYWAGAQYAAEKANMTQNTNPSTVKWKNWMNTNNVGIYQHSGQSWYRPHQSCKMRYLGTQYPFCSVCAQTFVKRFHDLTSPIDNYTPTATSLNAMATPMDFKLDVIYPSPNSLDMEWFLNGNSVATAVDSITVMPGSWMSGNNTIVANVEDTTVLVRIDTQTTHMHSVTWTVNQTATSIQVVENDIMLKTYPNPFQDQFLLEFELSEAANNIGLSVINLEGKVLQNQQFDQLPAGRFQHQLDLDELPAGTYLLRILLNGAIFNKKIQKIE